MPHDKHCGCGCGHDHDHDHDHDHIHASKPPVSPEQLTDNQKDFLHELGHRRYLPVARFTMTNSRKPDFICTALAPVFIRNVADDMAAVKEAGAFLEKLEDLGLITLDYDIPLNGYPYSEYKESELYEYFCKTVAEAAEKPGYLGDTPVLELGSMALTEEGESIAASHCGHTEGWFNPV